MLARVACLAAALTLAFVLLPVAAEAVTGTVVTPRGSTPPTRIKISRAGAPPMEVAVRSDRTFDAELPPGTYTAEADGYRKTTFTVAPGATTASIALDPIDPWAQNPGELGRFGLGLGYDATSLGDMDKKVDRTTLTARDAQGTIVGRTVVDGADDQGFERPFDLDGLFFDVPVGLGRVDLRVATLYPAAVVTVGWYDFEFAPRNRQNGMTTTFSGNGVVTGGGIELLGSRRPWWAALSVLYRTNIDTSVDVSPRAQPPAGGTVTQDGDLDFEQWVLALRIGLTLLTGWRYLGAVAPFVGVEGSWTDVTIDTRVLGRFSDGRTLTIESRQALERNTWRGLIGVDVHVTRGLFARIQGSFDDLDHAVLVKVVYQFDLPG